MLIVRPGLAEAAEARGFDWLVDCVREVFGQAGARERPAAGEVRSASALVHVYRYTLGLFTGGRCKYHPSCSQYALDALAEFGLFRGVGARRLAARCAATRGAMAASTTRVTRRALPVARRTARARVIVARRDPHARSRTSSPRSSTGSTPRSASPGPGRSSSLTVMVRIVLLPLTVKQIRSMQRSSIYAPQLKALQQKYKGDKQRLNEEVMKFYKENKVNPAASCLPILPQIPVFISLFYVLRTSRRRSSRTTRTRASAS